MASRESSTPSNDTRKVLLGYRALVAGIANEHSIAYGCASAFRELGAELAITYLNDTAKRYVEPLAKKLDAAIFAPLDVTNPARSRRCSSRLRKSGAGSTFSFTRSPGPPRTICRVGSSTAPRKGSRKSMDISCHSFIRMAKLAAPLMTDGGTMFAMTYHGAQKVVANYNVMGPVKAALECACRYLAFELGPQKIRVHAISPGPLKTRAASGLKDFDLLLNMAVERAPVGELVDIHDVGFACACLATPYGRRITGETLYVDGGVNIMA